MLSPIRLPKSDSFVSAHLLVGKTKNPSFSIAAIMSLESARSVVRRKRQLESSLTASRDDRLQEDWSQFCLGSARRVIRGRRICTTTCVSSWRDPRDRSPSTILPQCPENFGRMLNKRQSRSKRIGQCAGCAVDSGRLCTCLCRRRAAPYGHAGTGGRQ